MRHTVGIDFDNTLICYDRLFYDLATNQKLIPPGTSANKKTIRDVVRGLDMGEVKWQRLQALAYGPEIWQALLPGGVEAFFARCKLLESQVYIISHKTKFASRLEKDVNLRESALDWMQTHGFFHAAAIGLRREEVFFESSKCKKIERIIGLGCTHFIDDLEETFLDESFPQKVSKILYDPHQVGTAVPGVTPLSSWSDIGAFIFNE